MGSFYKIQVINDDNEEQLGFVRVRQDTLRPTFSQVREEIEGDELLCGVFEFIDDDKYILNKRQEERWTLDDRLLVRIKRSSTNVEGTSSPSKRQCIQENVEENYDTQSKPCSRISSTLLSASVLEHWQQECDRTRSKLKVMNIPRDDRFELHTEDFDGQPRVQIWCHECGSLYGKGSVEGKKDAYNCFANFMRTHILESKKHEKNYMAFRGLRKEAMHHGVAKNEEGDRQVIEASIEKLHSYMATNEGWDFEVVQVTLHDLKDKSFVRVRCKYNDAWLPLCPPRSDLHTVLMEHTKSNTHNKAVAKEKESSKPLFTGLRGRPRKEKEHDPKQISLNNFVVSTKIASSTTMGGSSSLNNHEEGT